MRRENIPNLLTVSRFFISPVAILFIALGCVYKDNLIYGSSGGVGCTLWCFIGGVFFFIAVVTDFLDGYLSRKWNVVSNFGKVFDPVSDKLLVLGTMIVLLSFGRISLWIGILLIARDVLMDLIRLSLYKKNIVIAANNIAKWKTATQMISLLLSIFLFSNLDMSSAGLLDWRLWLCQIPLAIALIFSLLSFFLYMEEIYIKIRKQ